MQITDFEKKIQSDINPDLTIRINPNADDISGVYYQGMYIGVALPPQEIKEHFTPKYHDRFGSPYRSIAQAEMIIRAKLPKFQDEEVMAVMKQKI